MDAETATVLRGRAKAALTRTINFIDKNDQTFDKNDIRNKLEKLELTYTKFDKADAALPIESSEMEEFETKYYETKAKLPNILENLSVRKYVYNENVTHEKQPYINKSKFNNSLKCSCCKMNHLVFKCSKFKEMSVKERIQLVNKQKLCMNCLSDKHTESHCNSTFTCHYYWDSPIPQQLTEDWLRFQKAFNAINYLTVPRWVILTADNIVELHGFADASSLAYAAAIYCRQKHNGKIKEYYIFDVFAWTDSKIVLSWLSGHPRQWKTFVANRTSEIIEVLPTKHWRHVPSKENPADIASRGIDPKCLPDCKLWWQGPPWLRLETSSWPKAESSCDEASDEVKAEQKISLHLQSVYSHIK
ncbi:DUF1758 domain-containing protein [Trichonephila clavipes]|nr:DUF1758 domain-containing protein [Trichonephila clavipes]